MKTCNSNRNLNSNKNWHMDELIRQFQEYGFKEHPLRKEYEAKVRNLEITAIDLLKSGLLEKDVARIVHQQRRSLGQEYKEAVPSPFREYIFFATKNVYGDPLGPSFKQLLETKSYDEIIKSSYRPIPNLDDRLNMDDFITWLKSNHQV